MPSEGEWFGQRYRIVQEIGRGGAAVVYRAWDERLGAHVALKVLDPDIASPRVHRRFRQEAMLQANLSHPSIVAAIDWLEDDGRLAMVMAYVDGPDLATWLAERGRLSLHEMEGIMTPVCSAIAHAHRKGVLHRDLKPANILLRRQGRRFDALVTDFGVAKLTDSQVGQTQVGAMIGTPEYMPPEQRRGVADLDGRVDVFALGVMLYEMATGRRPTPADGMPAPPSTLVPGLGSAFDALVADAMQPDRARRLASVEELADSLALAVGRRTTGPHGSATTAMTGPDGRGRREAPPPPTILEPRAPVEPSPSRPMRIALVFALLAALAVVALYADLGNDAEAPPETRATTAQMPSAQCVCTKSPTQPVVVECSSQRDGQTVATHERRGTEWVRTAERLKTTAPARSRELALKAACAFACVRDARPGHSRTLGNLGWAIELLGDRRQALDLQDRMRDHTTNVNLLAAAWFSTARLHCADGNASAARRAVERSLKLKPSGKGVETRRALHTRITDTCDG